MAIWDGRIVRYMTRLQLMGYFLINHYSVMRKCRRKRGNNMIKFVNKLIWICCAIVWLCPVVQVVMLYLNVDDAFRLKFVPQSFVFFSFFFLIALFIYGLINIIVHKVLSVIQKKKYTIVEYVVMCGCAVIIYIVWIIYALMVA